MIEITDEYKRVFDVIKNKEPFVFVTGSGGTGKSTLIHEIAKLDNVVVTSSTGLSALNIGGVTLHSLFGLPPTIVTPELARLDKNFKVLSVMEVLVIDEISMIRGDILDTVNHSLQAVKHNKKPFGGVTVIGVGDLFQLPPVTDKKDLSTLKKLGYPSGFFFTAHCLKLIEYKVIELTKIFRQEDGEFKRVLEDMRFGKNRDKVVDFLNTKVGVCENTITLCCTNKSVAAINTSELGKLTTPMEEFDYESKGVIPKANNLPAPMYLKVKVGAMVMLTKNHESRMFVNGTTGKIVEITDEIISVDTGETILGIKRALWQNMDYYLKEGKIETVVLGSYQQFPMVLAFATTIHKSQGRTIDKLTLDLGNGAFASGQAYVAISRLTSFEGLTLAKPMQKRDIIVSKQCLRYMGV